MLPIKISCHDMTLAPHRLRYKLRKKLQHRREARRNTSVSYCRDVIWSVPVQLRNIERKSVPVVFPRFWENSGVRVKCTNPKTGLAKICQIPQHGLRNFQNQSQLQASTVFEGSSLPQTVCFSHPDHLARCKGTFTILTFHFTVPDRTDAIKYSCLIQLQRPNTLTNKE